MKVVELKHKAVIVLNDQQLKQVQIQDRGTQTNEYLVDLEQYKDPEHPEDFNEAETIATIARELSEENNSARERAKGLRDLGEPFDLVLKYLQ